MKNDKKAKIERTKLEDAKTKKKTIPYLSLVIILLLYFIYGEVCNITGFSFGLEKVKAAEAAAGYCHFKVEEETITGNSVVIAWYCTDGVGIDNYTFYDKKNKKVNIKNNPWDVFNANGKYYKSDRLKISGFKPNSNYKVGFKTTEGVTGEVSFKTNGNGKNIDKEELGDIRIASPYVWTSDETSTSIKVHWRGFGAYCTSHAKYIDSDCNEEVDEDEKKTGSYISNGTQIGSFDILNLKPEQCYVIQLKFDNNEIVSKSYSTKTSSSGTNNSSGSISSNNDDNAYIDGDGNWETEDSSDGGSVKKDEIPQINKANNFICSENSSKEGTLRNLLNRYWSWVVFLTPFALIIFITYDFIKALSINDSDAIKKSVNSSFKRVIAAILLLLAPYFIYVIFGWFGLTFCFY